MSINTQFVGNAKGILFIAGADTKYLPTPGLKPRDKFTSTIRQAGFGGQGGNVFLRDIMVNEERNDECQGIPGLIVLSFLQRQQVIITADNLKNLITIGEELH